MRARVETTIEFARVPPIRMCVTAAARSVILFQTGIGARVDNVVIPVADLPRFLDALTYLLGVTNGKD